MKHEDLLPYFATDVLGCPEPTMLQNVALAAEEFFRRTLMWQATLDPIRIRTGPQLYDLDFDANTELAKLLTASTSDDRDLNLVERSRAGRLLRSGCGGWFAYIENRQTVGTSDMGGANGRFINLDVALKPPITATEFPDEFAEHANDIALCASYRTLMMPRQAWSDMGLAGAKKTLFDDRVQTVTLQQAKSFSRAKPRSAGFFY